MFKFINSNVNQVGVVTVTATVLVGVLLLDAFYRLPLS